MKNTPIGVLLNPIKMLDSFQNNIIVLIIHVTIASWKKEKEKRKWIGYISLFSTKLTLIGQIWCPS